MVVPLLVAAFGTVWAVLGASFFRSGRTKLRDPSGVFEEEQKHREAEHDARVLRMEQSFEAPAFVARFQPGEWTAEEARTMRRSAIGEVIIGGLLLAAGVALLGVALWLAMT